jgi:hypothetical protein
MTLRNAFEDLATDQRLDQTNALLRRLVKIMESQATVDGQNRQRMTMDAIAAGLTLGTVSTITNPVPIGNVATMSGVDHRQFADIARTAFNTGLRSKLN